MTTVRIRHIKALGYCNRGSRAWMAAQGIEWSDFLRNGIPHAERLAEKTGDDMAIKLLRFAQEEDRRQEEAENG